MTMSWNIPAHSPSTTALAASLFLILLFLARHTLQRLSEERRLRALATHPHAPRVRTWLPWDADFIASAIRRNAAHDTLGFWQMLMATYANPRRPATVELRPGGQRFVFTVDDENIKAVLATQFADFGKGERFHAEWKDFLGDSIFTTDGHMWHTSRQLIRPQFIKDRVSDLQVFEKHVSVLLPLLAGQPGNGSGGHDNINGPAATATAPAPVNLVDIFFRYTLDAATDFLLGSSVNSLSSTSEVRFAEAFAEVQHIQGLIARAGPFNKFVPRKKFFAELKIMDSFIQPFIDQALQLTPEELEQKTKTDEGYTFLHALASFTRDPKVLRDQLAAVLLAGRDTTAMTLSWMFYELSRQPRIVRKLRQEIADTVGMDRAPTYEHLKSMRYLAHTISETLRLYPIVPYNVRIALKDTTLPRGGGKDGMQPIGVLSGTPIGYSTLVMQRRAELYPPPSEKFPHYLDFSPERWETWNPKLWTYIPFNGGPRICIGQQFALTEIGYTTVRILQRYAELENCMSIPPGLKADIVLQPSDGVEVKFHQ